MGVLSSDTHPKIEAMQIEILRRMPSWKKFGMLDDLNATVRILALSGLKERHPDASPEQLHYMLAELMLGSELAQRVYLDAG